MSELITLRKKLKKRNYQELLACIIVIVAFIYIGLDRESTFTKIFCFEIVFSAIFVGLYLYLQSHKKISEKNDTKEHYISILNNEINLLSRARYWYVLPFQIGLFGLSLEDLILTYRAGENLMWSIFSFLLCIGVSLGAIYFTEVKGVRALKEELGKIIKV